jgi:hypothetical protein
MSRRMSHTRRLILVLFLNLALITAQVAVGVAAHSAELLRHSQIAMTMEIYTEVSTAKTRSALKRLGGKFDRWRCCMEPE